MRLHSWNRKRFARPQTIRVKTTADDVSPNSLTSLRKPVLLASAVPVADDMVIDLRASQVDPISADRGCYQPTVPEGDTALSRSSDRIRPTTGESVLL
jgi:hypothetical protein